MTKFETLAALEVQVASLQKQYLFMTNTVKLEQEMILSAIESIRSTISNLQCENTTEETVETPVQEVVKEEQSAVVDTFKEESLLQLEVEHTDAPVIPASGPIIFREPGEVQKFTVKGKIDLSTIKEDPIYVVESDLTDDEAVQMANAILTFTDHTTWCGGKVASISIHLKKLPPRNEGDLPYILWKPQVYEVDAYDDEDYLIGTSNQFYLSNLDKEIVEYLRKQTSFGKYDLKAGTVADCFLSC